MAGPTVSIPPEVKNYHDPQQMRLPIVIISLGSPNYLPLKAEC